MKSHFQILSKDTITPLNCVMWQPKSTEPKAILQIIHGMAEFIDRYDEFAAFLVAQNILVVGHDHLGHGHSVDMDNPLYGYFAKEESPNILIEDAYQLTEKIQFDFPNVPYYVLGHSMGSFVLRNYLTRYGGKIAGAIIMGTGGKRPELSAIMPTLTALNKKLPTKKNTLLDSLAFGKFPKYFPEKKSTFNWLSKNQDNVENYETHPLTGFIFTNNGFYTLFSLMVKATEDDWFALIDRHLPILIISGEQDPVGDFGKGPRQVATALGNSDFTDITLHLYRNLRHEILNETEKIDVMTDIYHWIDNRL